MCDAQQTCFDFIEIVKGKIVPSPAPRCGTLVNFSGHCMAALLAWVFSCSLIALCSSDWYSLLSQLTNVLGIALPLTTSTWLRKLNTRVSLSKRYLQAAQQRETKSILYFLLDGRQKMCYRRSLTSRPVLWRIPTMPGQELVSWLMTILFGSGDKGIFEESLLSSLCGDTWGEIQMRGRRLSFRISNNHNNE